jgi:demethylmenaquinone methyltransferase/2-methoxy-6-polyprenyl-1,4-benzoquinol methylase
MILRFFTLFQDDYWKDDLLQRASLRAGDLVLDIGCGTGVLEERIGNLPVQIVGVDLTKEMLLLAAQKKLECVDALLLGDAERLPFVSERFDVVLSCYVIKYCKTEDFVAQIARMLKPGGMVVIYDFARPSGVLAPLHGFYIYGILRLLGKFAKGYDPSISFTFSKLPNVIARSTWEDEIEGCLVRAGFVGVRHKTLSGGGAKMFWACKNKF